MWPDNVGSQTGKGQATPEHWQSPWILGTKLDTYGVRADWKVAHTKEKTYAQWRSHLAAELDEVDKLQEMTSALAKCGGPDSTGTEIVVAMEDHE